MVSEKLYEYILSWMPEQIDAEYTSIAGNVRRDANIRKLNGFGAKPWVADRMRLAVRRCVCYDEHIRFKTGDTKNILYVYNGMTYELVENSALFLKELIKRAFVSLGVPAAYNDEYPSKIIAESCLDTLTSSDKYLYKPSRRYIAFRNAVYDVERGRVVKATPEQMPYVYMDLEYKDKDMLYKECSNAYGLNSPCYRWDTFIKEVLPNTDARSVFQQWCGALLADKERYKLEHVLFLVGPGANGKSVVSNVIASVLGKEYISRFSFRQLFKDSDRNVNIAALRGKLANVIDDADAREISGGDFKRFASGGEFQGRAPYEKKPVMVVAPPLLCCCNEEPETNDDTYGGHRRRLVIHTCPNPIPEEKRDTQLTYKLTREEGLMYIFHWITAGYRMYVRNNGDIALSGEMKKAQEDAMNRSNSMRRWWSENCYVAVENYDPAKWRSLKDLMSEYDAFCEAEHSDAFRQPELSAMLKSKGCFQKRQGTGYGYCLERKVDNYD